MACKYKITKEDFFGGTPYCSLHDDFCINLKFACDTNCQIYEDQKELEKIKELFNRTCKCKHLVLDECSLTGKNCISINECLYQNQQILTRVKNACNGIYTRTKEAKQLKDLLMHVMREVQNVENN